MITQSPDPALFDDGLGTGRSAVDIWVVSPNMYDANGHAAYVNQASAKGDQVWSYNTGEWNTYSPKWIISYSPINFRIQPGFINQSLGMTGLLYWQVDTWTNDPWNTFIYPDAPGEGMFIYPGTQVGLPSGTAVASMRLKWLRDGVDDYDYIQLLKNKGDGAWALEQAKTAGPDWTNWTKDINTLENVRTQLGDRLGGNAGTTPTPIPTNTPTPTPGSNIALNRPAIASSIQSASFPASYAVDGNINTQWSSAYSDPQWIYIDLGAIYNLNRVVLKWEAAYGKAYQIQISDNASTWTTIYSTTTGDGGIDDITLSGTGRYVRMYGTQRATVYGYSLWEFEIYGSTPGTTPNTYTYKHSYSNKHANPNSC